MVQAWAPLGSGSLGLAASAACEEIGAKYGKSSAQVALPLALVLNSGSWAEALDLADRGQLHHPVPEAGAPLRGLGLFS